VTPRLTAGQAPRRSRRRQQAGLVFRPAGFYSFLSGATSRWSQNRFPTQRGGFCIPGTGGAFTVSTDTVPVTSTGTASEVRSLTSSHSSRGQSSGGALWRPASPLLNSLTSSVYPGTFVQSLYISCYVSINKLVLSYLLSCLLPQDFFLLIPPRVLLLRQCAKIDILLYTHGPCLILYIYFFMPVFRACKSCIKKINSTVHPALKKYEHEHEHEHMVIDIEVTWIWTWIQTYCRHGHAART
jgi:hypothetical protein